MTQGIYMASKTVKGKQTDSFLELLEALFTHFWPPNMSVMFESSNRK
jgi:hypothetical protein